MSEWHREVPKLLVANLEFRAKIALVCETDADARETIRQMCADDLLFFVNVFVWTLDPRKLSANSTTAGAETPFISWDYQDEAFQALDLNLLASQDVLIEKSRDMGASWIVCIWFLWRWLFHDHQSFLMVSRKETLVDGDDDSLFSHIDFVLKRLPLWLVPSKSFERTKLYLKNLDNGSVIEGESTTDNIGRGGRRTAILLDEFPAFEGGGYTALSATADTTNCRIMNGTPKGTANAFYAQREKGTRRIRMHWSRHPEKRRGLYRPLGNGEYERLDPACDYAGVAFVDEVPRSEEGFRSPWYDKECNRRAHAWEIAQELDIDYQGSNWPFFDPRVLEKLRLDHCRPPKWIGRIEKRERARDGEAVYIFKEDPRGHLKLWIDLVQPPGAEHGKPPGGRDYVIGSDVSQGTGASDSASSVLDLLSGCKVAELAYNKWGINEYARLIIELGYFFTAGGSPAFLIWEATGPGRTLGKVIVEELKYPRFYQQKDDTKLGAAPTQKYGWYASLDGKRDLLQTYRELLTAHTFINPSAEAIREAGFYVFEGGKIEWRGPSAANDPSNQGTNHGDRVTADALCAKILFDWKGGKAHKGQQDVNSDAPILSPAWRWENWTKRPDDEGHVHIDSEY